jgi:hypothetical protein
MRAPGYPRAKRAHKDLGLIDAKSPFFARIAATDPRKLDTGRRPPRPEWRDG